jgi:DNA-binding NtrC family response regulator
MKPTTLIYIVDDEQFNLLLISRKLKQQLHCRTRLFKNIPDAIRVIKKHAPDLILCDYRFTTESGEKLTGDYMIQWVNANAKNIPLLMYSSFQNIELAVSMIRKGACDFIVRDEDFLDKLMRRVKAHLRKIGLKSEKRISKGKIVFSIVAVSGILLFFHFYQPSLLLRVCTTILLLGVGMLFLKEPIEKYFS